MAQQTHVDSIYTKVNNTNNDSLKSVYYKQLASYFFIKDKTKAYSYIDSVIFFAKKTKNKQFYLLQRLYLANTQLYDYKYRQALNNFKELLVEFTEINDTPNFAIQLNNIGFAYYNLAKYDSAKAYFLQSIKFYKKIGNEKQAAQTLNNIGIIYDIYGKPIKAIDYYMQALKIYNKQKEYAYYIGTAINIGVVYLNQQQFKSAIDFALENINYLDSIKNKRLKIDYLQNLAIAYDDINDFGNALKYYNLALKYSQEINDNLRTAKVYTNLSSSYSMQGKKEESLKYAIKAIEIKKEIGDLASLVISQLGLADSYRNYGYNYDAIKYYIIGIKNAEKIKYQQYIRMGYLGLSKSYFNINDYKNAYLFLSKYTDLNDSLINTENNKVLSELKTKYQTEKKEQQIKIQKDKIEKQQIKQEKTSLQRNFILVGLVLTLVLAVVILRSYYQKKKANQKLTEQKMHIAEQNEELNQQNEEITAQRDEIEAQRNTVVKQKEQIEEIHLRLTDSIEYAKRIQKSILPKQNELNNYFPDNFIFFKPKDVVSGDFYWWKHLGDYTVITAADCTGHGVPGAFMSMLGISLLREIVEKENIIETGKILNLLRENIIASLQQAEDNDELQQELSVKDGIDMAIISINHKTNIVQFSGANNPLYIIKPVIANEQSERGNLPKDNLPLRGAVTTKQSHQENKPVIPNKEERRVKESHQKNNQPLTDSHGLRPRDDALILVMTNNELGLYEIKPDKMPIAIYAKKDNFTTYKIQLEKGDQLYMFSDGYADQFGGPKSKKFKYKPFKRLLLENANKPMKEQKEILEKIFTEWKGNNEQVDDVTVVGLKI